MARLIVQFEKDSDRPSMISQLSLWGQVEQLSSMPQMVFVDGPASMLGAVKGIPGVRSAIIETSDDFRLDSVTHDFVPMAPENTGQHPLVIHGNHPDTPLWDNYFDLARPGQVARFNYDPTVSVGNGTGVNIYVVDSGIRPTHEQFTGRFGGQLIDRHNDGEGFHGVAVASCAAGNSLGVATGATVFDCKGFPFSGSVSSSDLISSMNAALTHFNANSQPGVVNCSFGGAGGSNPYDTVINSMVEAGMVVVSSSGNDGEDLTSNPSNRWPAEDPDCLTVGGMDSFYRLHERANHYGSTDIYAHFQQWTTADHFADDAYSPAGRIRGTSFSGPMVAGMVARALTGTTKMTSRAQVEAFVTQFLTDYGVLDLIDKTGSLLDKPRLYIPGVTKTGFVAYTPPVRGIPDSVPIQIDRAILLAVMGGRADGVSTRYAQTQLVMGSRADGISTRHARTYAIVEE